MATVDLPALAKRLIQEANASAEAGDSLEHSFIEITITEALAVAALIEAAGERALEGHDERCVTMQPYGRRCTCGHDALAAALGRGR